MNPAAGLGTLTLQTSNMPGAHELVFAPPARFRRIGVVSYKSIAVGHEVRQYVLEVIDEGWMS